MTDKMTDNEIIKVWARCLMDNEDCSKCPLLGIGCHEQILDILNRQKAEIERLNKPVPISASFVFELANQAERVIKDQEKEIENFKQIAENQQSVSMDKEVEIKRLKAEVERLEKEGEELQYKLECLLCHSTGGKMSKSTYPLRTMEIGVDDNIQDYCEEARDEAVKEFAERLKEKAKANEWNGTICGLDIDNLLKEMVGEDK